MTDIRGHTYTEEHRHRCEVRQLLLWRLEHGSRWVHNYIDGEFGPGRTGALVLVRPGLRKKRGDEAADRLLADCRRQFAWGNTGAPDDWRTGPPG